MTILIPTDFSACARNAADYAFSLFSGREVRYVLFNTFKVDILGFSGKSYEQLKRDSERMLEDERNRLSEQYGVDQSRIAIRSMEGHVNYINAAFLDDLGIDLVIMGTDGISEEDKYLGTTHAAELVTRLNRNVFVIPNGVSFGGHFRKVLLTTDLELPLNQGVTDTLRMVLNGATTVMFHVVDNEQLSDDDREMKSLLLELLKGKDVVVEEVRSTQIDRVIRQAIKLQQMDAVVIFPHHQGFFDRIFHSSVSRRLAQTTPVPLLALHK
jgi:nucleotide-binding universal stress UspA family protein